MTAERSGARRLPEYRFQMGSSRGAFPFSDQARLKLAPWGVRDVSDGKE